MIKRFLDFVGFANVRELFSAYTISEVDGLVWDWAVEEGIPSWLASHTMDKLIEFPCDKWVV